MARRIIPFSWLPGSWGLKGKTFEKAKAEYELFGRELKEKLAELEYGPDSDELKMEKILTDYARDKISKYEFRIAESNIIFKDEPAKTLRILEIDKEFSKITEKEYEKRKATLEQKPWVNIVNFELNSGTPSQIGEVELDWNEYFIEDLKKAGYNGPSDHVIIDKWFNMVCLTVAIESGLVDPATSKGPDEGLPPLPGGRKEYS